MIHRLSSDLPGFKTLQFHAGLNMLVADKSPGASNRQTRNGSGKSSMVQLVHFLLGSNTGPDSIFRTPELVNSAFEAELKLKGRAVRVTRSGHKPSAVILEGDTSGWPIQPELDKKTGLEVMKNDPWKVLLGHLIFGFPIAEDTTSTRLHFRDVMPYFARRHSDGGFQQHDHASKKQQPWVIQSALTWLFGLDVSVPYDWQTVRERERSLKELKKAVTDGGALGSVIGSTSALRTQLTLAEERVRKLRQNLASFRVLDQYHELEIEASELTRKISDLASLNAVDKEYADALQEALSQEAAPPPSNLERLYREAGVVLPQLALKRFEEVQEFHASVVQNRRSYLQGELQDIGNARELRIKEIHRLEDRRAAVMQMLSTHGALDHFSQLQRELSRAEGEVEHLRQRFSSAEVLETEKVQLTLERNRLRERLKRDYFEQQDVLRSAILKFENYSASLYEKAGNLEIDDSENGPTFKVTIHGQESRGIQNMQIFCFDMMLMELCAERNIGPGFLIHDSHLFDGVDERQVAKALALGAEAAAKHRFQYIVTMNSDVMPRDGYPPGFEVNSHRLPVRLTDATEDGGLFGLRFK